MAVSSPRAPSAKLLKESFGIDLKYLAHSLSQLLDIRNCPRAAIFHGCPLSLLHHPPKVLGAAYSHKQTARVGRPEGRVDLQR